MDTLTDRERFLRAMRYEPVDRVPSFEMPLWGQTIDRWYAEGMPLCSRKPVRKQPGALPEFLEFFATCFIRDILPNLTAYRA